MAIKITTTFPKDPILVKLLQASQLTAEQIIHDAYGFDKTYGQLLSDIIATRNALRRSLPPSVLNPEGLLREECPFVGALTFGGYEFIVAFFAVRALGGACWPLASGILPEEANHYLSTSKTAALLAGKSSMALAGEIANLVKSQGLSEFVALQVFTDGPPIDVGSVVIDYSLDLDPRGPGAVICTSGTSTGIPKAAVLPRLCLVESRPPKLGEATLSHRPPYWRGGFASVIAPPIEGKKLYSLKQWSPAITVWNTLRKHHITNLVFNPVLLRQMKEVYTEKLSNLPANEREAYVSGFRNLECIRCSGAFLAPSLLRFWTELTGMRFKNAYGSTECGGGVTYVNVRKPSTIRFSCGQIAREPPVEIKLSEGTRGEFLVKSPWMLIRYIGNEEATKAAFDKDGYYKTGDIGKLVGDEYVYEGRANDDFIKEIPRIPVELAILNLPYISEGYVLRIPDHEDRAVSGALIRVKKNTVMQRDMTIEKLHSDLTGKLPAYMRPYLLRVLADDEHIPLTHSQKPSKRGILKQFFGVTDFWNRENPAPGVQVWPTKFDVSDKSNATDGNPWDFAGWQG
ncbi:hypothetical protein FQN49_004921 [Arthroderma sp. PD_2]|nr:hypothetical protein FQN49_004921 [Arthroderma sp. PD_2]